MIKYWENVDNKLIACWGKGGKLCVNVDKMFVNFNEMCEYVDKTFPCFSSHFISPFLPFYPQGSFNILSILNNNLLYSLSILNQYFLNILPILNQHSLNIFSKLNQHSIYIKTTFYPHKINIFSAIYLCSINFLST